MLKDILSDARNLFPAASQAELRAQLNRRRSVGLIGGNLTANERVDVSGVSARVYQGGVYGFSSMAACTQDAAKAVLNAAKDNAAFMDKHIQKGEPALPPLQRGVRPPDGEISDVPQNVYIDFLRQVDDYIARKYPGLASRMVMSRADSFEKLLVTADGWDCHTVLPRSYVYIFLTAEAKDGAPVEVFAPVGGFGTFDKNFLDTEAVCRKADVLYEQLMAKREGVFAEAGLKTCVLSGELTGMLAHEAVGHTVEADLVAAGSVAAANLGKQVASELVHLTDFAHTALGEAAPLPVYVDDEGTPAEDAQIIKNGILVNYLHDRASAQRYGMKPQGNARAYLFSDEPLIRMRNTAILPGKDKLEDLIASVEDGYYLVGTNNGQADTTGEFMFGVCMGYEIKGGKLGRAIRDTTISGVAFEMLKTVDGVGDTLTWTSSGFCGKKQPMPVGCGGPDMRCKVMIGGR